MVSEHQIKHVMMVTQDQEMDAQPPALLKMDGLVLEIDHQFVLKETKIINVEMDFLTKEKPVTMETKLQVMVASIVKFRLDGAALITSVFLINKDLTLN